MSFNLNSLFVYLNGEIKTFENSYLHISDLSIQRGYGIFDFFRLHDGQPLFLEDHLSRFYNSAEMMQLEIPVSAQELKSIIEQLHEKNNLELSGMKMVLTGGYSPNGYDLATPNFFIVHQPVILPSAEQVEKGIKIITHEYVREIPKAKTINYTTGIRLIQKIRAQAADDVLYHMNGVVTEFPRSNFFLVKQDNTVVTPAQDVLPGITRKNVLTLAGKKYPVQETEVTLQDILEAKEAFLTSTTKRLTPIVQVDDQLIGNGTPGSVTMDLLQDLISLEQAYLSNLPAKK